MNILHTYTQAHIYTQTCFYHQCISLLFFFHFSTFRWLILSSKIINENPINYSRDLARQVDPPCLYSNVPFGHNSIGDMMPTISTNAGLYQRYTNHSFRKTSLQILDSKQFSGRHITSIVENIHRIYCSKHYTKNVRNHFKHFEKSTTVRTWYQNRQIKRY